MIPWWAEADAERHLLALREILVRCDENLKANTLMQECVPYFLEDDHPQVQLARQHQAQMVAHITDGDGAYRDYYAANSHEKPFEEQYEMQAHEAHERIFRVAVLRDSLEAIEKDRVRLISGELPTLLDCACNDGWMGANLVGLVAYHGIDLNPDCIARAGDRRVRRGLFFEGDLSQAEVLTAEDRPAGGYDYVVCFEVIEHVPDPDATLATLVRLCKPGGHIFVSTPLGAVESGDLPQWWKVEPKGHVRVYTPRTFTELLERHAVIEGLVAGPDQVMVARLHTVA